MIRKVELYEIDAVFDLLRQESLRGYNGQFADTEKEWITNFIPNCFAFGLYEDNIMVAVLLAEKLSGNGCMIWYLAVDPNKQSKGYGSELYLYFENYIKTNEHISWIYTTAAKTALTAHKKLGFITSEYSTVYEHVKEI